MGIGGAIPQANSTSRAPALLRALGVGRLAAFSTDEPQHDGAPRAIRRFVTELQSVERSTWRWAIEVGIMALVTLLGFWGFQESADAGVRWRLETMCESAFRTMQLLTTQFPKDLGNGTLPLQLQFARFAMPIFAAWFSLRVILRRLNRPVWAWTAGWSRGHVVLIGSSNVAVALARAFRRAGRRVVAVASTMPRDGEALTVEQAGSRVVFGDWKRERVLRRAAVHRAAATIVADDIGTDAFWVATSVAKLCRQRRDRGAAPLGFLVRLGHRELRSLLRSQIASAFRERGSNVDLKLYVREQTLARSLLSRYPVDWGLPPGAHDIHAAVVGLGNMGGELLLQLARTAVPLPGKRALFTLIDREADGLKDQLLAENPGLSQCAELRFVQADIHASAISGAQVETWFNEPLPVTVLYICCGDDDANLSLAIGIRRAYALKALPPPPMFVYQSDTKSLIEGLPELHGPAFDSLRIVGFGGIDEEADPFFVLDEEIDVLAREVHEQYLADRRKTTASPPSAADVPWASLAESYRIASRSQADHILSKLRALGWHAVDGRTATPPAPDRQAFELMSSQEHDRWCRERWLAGWTLAETPSAADLRSPYLVPYEQLTEEIREFDRSVVSGLPKRLETLGLGLRSDWRVGIWFDGPDSPAARSIDATMARLMAPDGDQPRHVQLVLPLRNAGECAIAARLGRRAAAGVDVAMLPGTGGAGGGGSPIAPRDVGRLIGAADRAFFLPAAKARAESRDAAILSALAEVCDRVLLVCDDRASGESLLAELADGPRVKMEIVAP